MAIRQIATNFNTRADMGTEIHPHVFESGDVYRPKGSNRADKDGGSSHQFAPFMPVVWQDTRTGGARDWFCLMMGKIVGLTADGWVYPAGLRLEIEAAAGGDTIFTYTADDVDQKVMDIVTGSYVTAAGVRTKTAVQAALLERGLIAAGETILDYFKKPVGSILQVCYSPFSIDDATDPTKLKYTNYLKQKGIQYTTKTQMHLPMVPFQTAASDTIPAALAGAAAAFGTLGVHVPAEVVALTRYELIDATDYVALFLDEVNVAKNTERSPIECSNSAVLVREIKLDYSAGLTGKERIANAVARLRRTGDFFVDEEVGVIFMYESGGNAVVGAGATVSYYIYDGAFTASDVTKYMCVEGLVKPGDYVKLTERSNLTKWISGTDDESLKLGRVHGVVREPNGLVDQVRTTSGLPGSATAGYSANVVATNAANLIAKIVLDVR
jgi:hypothetical protein